MMRAWLESAATGCTPANNAHNKMKGNNFRKIMFTPSRGRWQTLDVPKNGQVSCQMPKPSSRQEVMASSAPPASVGIKHDGVWQRLRRLVWRWHGCKVLCLGFLTLRK